MTAIPALSPMTACVYRNLAAEVLLDLQDELRQVPAASQQPALARRLFFCIAIVEREGSLSPERCLAMADELPAVDAIDTDMSARRLLGFLEARLAKAYLQRKAKQRRQQRRKD